MFEMRAIPSSIINREKQGKRRREDVDRVGREWCNLYRNTVVGRKGKTADNLRPHKGEYGSSQRQEQICVTFILRVLTSENFQVQPTQR